MGMTPLPTTNENELKKLSQQVETWVNGTAQTGTNAITEQVCAVARQACRLVGARLAPGAAVTGAATNFFTLLIAKRTVLAPGTGVNLITFAADTATTDDIAAFAARDLFATATYVTGANGDAYDLEEGDVLTVAVTKTGTGMTFPIASLSLMLEPRT